MDTVNRGTQTAYTVYQEDIERNGKVSCFKATQTVTHIDVDEVSPDKIVALLEFTPFSQIKENCIQVIDLPNHILKFSSDTSVVHPSTKKSALKKNEFPSVKRKLSTGEKGKTDDEAQTQLLVSPHLLGDDSLPIVAREEATQTNFTSDYPEYRNKLLFNYVVQHETITGDEEGTSKHKKSCNMPITTSHISTKKFVSGVDITNSKTEMEIREKLNFTAIKLQEQLERMFKQYGEVEEEVSTTEAHAQHSTEGMILGDSSDNKRIEILCECQCAGAGGGGVPMLSEPKLDSDVIKEQHKKNKTDKCSNKSVNASSWPDLNEHNIRLKKNNEKNTRCRSSKSDTTNSCVGFKADRVMKPVNSTAQSFCLLVDQDGDYADSYLELLSHEQTGTQTASDDFHIDSCSDDSIRCRSESRCTHNIEMPWELLTYIPTIKQKKKPSPPPPEKEVCIDLTPSTLRLKQLTVEAMGASGLLELTEEAISDQLGEEDLTISEVERQILKIQKKDDVKISSVQNTKSEDSQIIRYPRIPPRKPQPNLVYEPSSERHNEPYMDRMYQYFPDDCDVTDACPSHIEMPWNKIVLPKTCNIRKQYKPNKSETDKVFNNCNLPEPKVSHLEFHLSFKPVENVASTLFSIKGTLSNTANRPKASVQRSLSQPFMVARNNKTDSFDISCKKSDLMRVHNFSDSKPTSCQTNNTREFTSMPSVSHAPHPRRTSSSGNSQSQRIAMLLESCKKEMEPIKDGINKLRLRIRELNLPDISSFQEMPQRPNGNMYPGYTSSYNAMGPSPQMPYFTQPCWSPYYPYLTPYQVPPNYGVSSAAPSHSKKSRSKSKSPTKKRSRSLTSSGCSDLDPPVMERIKSTSNKYTSKTDSIKPNKQKPSRIPKPINRQCSDISKPEVMGKKSSRSTNTSENCIAVSDLNCSVSTKCSSKSVIGVICDVRNTCSGNNLSTTTCSYANSSAKTSQLECGVQECQCQQKCQIEQDCPIQPVCRCLRGYKRQQEDQRESQQECPKKTVMRSRIKVDLNEFLPFNKYRKLTEDKSSLTGCPEELPVRTKDGESD